MLIQEPDMGYGDLSHTEVIIFYEAKLSGIYETEVWDDPICHGWLLDTYGITGKTKRFISVQLVYNLWQDGGHFKSVTTLQHRRQTQESSA